MKLVIMTTLCTAVLYAGCRSQKLRADKVPSVVVNTFQARFPAITGVDWKKIVNGYEAEADINDSTEVSVRFDETGKLLVTKQDVSNKEINATIMATIQQDYKDYEVDDVEKLETNGNVYYQVELKAKRKKEVNLVFTVEGREEKTVAYWD